MISFNHVSVWIRFAACFDNTLLSIYVIFANFWSRKLLLKSQTQTTKIAVSGGCFSLFYVFSFCIKGLSLPEIKKRKSCLTDSQFENCMKTAWHEIKKDNTWMLCNKWNFLPTLSLKNSVNWTLNDQHHMASLFSFILHSSKYVSCFCRLFCVSFDLRVLTVTFCVKELLSTENISNLAKWFSDHFAWGVHLYV